MVESGRPDAQLPPPSSCGMMVPAHCCVAMARRVPMRRMMMPGIGSSELLLHQYPAVVVPHDLPVAHAVALADRSA
jgi:hypothetical protein